MKNRINRRSFLASAASVLGLGIYSRFYEPSNLRVTRRSLSLPRYPEITLLHLSDLHASPAVSLQFIRRSIELGLKEKPDLICVTGDFISTAYDPPEGYEEVLRLLSQTAPTFACLGNHDGGHWSGRRNGYGSSDKVKTLLAASAITVLENQIKVFPCKTGDLQIAGLGDLWNNHCRPEIAFREQDPSLPTVVLSHNPDSKQLLQSQRWELMLCGHTHGGQFYLPLIGTPFAPVQDHRYVAGLNAWNSRWIHTTTGVGNLYGVRLNCPPEVALLQISPAA